jgi:hypothetical protein
LSVGAGVGTRSSKIGGRCSGGLIAKLG